MHCHCGTNNRAPRWTFTDPCKPEMIPGALEESASPAWLAAPAMNARDTKGVYGGLTLDLDRDYIGSFTATTHQEKGLITLVSNPSRGTVLPAPRGKGSNEWNLESWIGKLEKVPWGVRIAKSLKSHKLWKSIGLKRKSTCKPLMAGTRCPEEWAFF